MSKKRFILPFTVFAMLISFGLAACNGDNGGNQGGDNSGDVQDSQPASENKPSSAKQEKIVITAADNKTKLVYPDTVQLSADQEGVTWESAKPEIATVSSTGLVTAVSKGSASIKAIKEGFKDGSINISVDYPNITVNADKTSLLIGETANLTSSEAGVTWSSSDSTVVSVNNGVATALKIGSATIKASKDKYNDGSVTINVVRPAPTATLHMEDADHYTADGVWGTSYSGTMYGPGEESPVYERSSGNASDGTCIAYMDNGDKEILTFTSSAAVKAELVMMMAARSAVSDMSAVMSVKFNNADLDLAGKEFAGGGDTNTFIEFSFGDVDLVAGNNVMQFDFLGSSPYMDDLNIYAESATTIAVVQPAEKQDIVIGQENIKIAVGKTAQITSAITGLSYRSANTAVATVDDAGLVTGVAAGSTTINISKDGYKTLKLPVEVIEAEGAFKVNIDNITGEGVVTKESRNLTAPDNVMIDTFAVDAVGTLEFDAETAGTYTMYMKARASGGYSATDPDNLATCMELKVNGTKLDLTGEVTPGTFNTYLLGDVTLTAGKNVITIKCITSVPGINLFNFIPKA